MGKTITEIESSALALCNYDVFSNRKVFVSLKMTLKVGSRPAERLFTKV